MTIDAATWRRAVFIDTSAIFVVLNEKDVSHLRAADAVRTLRREGRLIFASNFMVAETHALLLRRFGREAGVLFLNRLRQGFVTVVPVTSEDEERAVEIIESYTDKAFSYTDATSFALMGRLVVTTAFSFDRHFAQYGLTTLGLGA